MFSGLIYLSPRISKDSMETSLHSLVALKQIMDTVFISYRVLDERFGHVLHCRQHTPSSMIGFLFCSDCLLWCGLVIAVSKALVVKKKKEAQFQCAFRSVRRFKPLVWIRMGYLSYRALFGVNYRVFILMSHLMMDKAVNQSQNLLNCIASMMKI